MSNKKAAGRNHRAAAQADRDGGRTDRADRADRDDADRADRDDADRADRDDADRADRDDADRADLSASGLRREDSGPVQSVDRAVTILEILARAGEAGVTEVARELDVHKSTASRLLTALSRGELVTQDTARGRFRLGVGILRLAGAAGRRLDVVQESRPVCQALAKQVGETVNLAILSGRDALYLDQVAGPAALSPHNWAGQRIPLHATSDGKVLLAYLPAKEVAEHLTPPLRRFTDRTITSLAEFPRVLAEVRQRGYATAVEELEQGLTAVAAPVRNAEGQVIASISASGPSFRIPDERISPIAGSVRRAAAVISRRLGWADPAGHGPG